MPMHASADADADAGVGGRTDEPDGARTSVAVRSQSPVKVRYLASHKAHDHTVTP